MENLNPQLWPADVVFTKGWGPVRFLQRTPGEGPTYAGHVAGMVTPGEGIEALVRVRRFSWSTFVEPCRVYRHINLHREQRIGIVSRWEAGEGRLYAPLKLGLHAVDWGLSWALCGLTLGAVRTEVTAARRLSFIDWLTICSQFIADGYEKGAGYSFGLGALKDNPDGMEDHCILSPDWELVFER